MLSIGSADGAIPKHEMSSPTIGNNTRSINKWIRRPQKQKNKNKKK